MKCNAYQSRLKTFKLLLIFSLVQIWSSQSLSIEAFGGNLRIGFLILLLLTFIKNPKLRKSSLITFLIISIFGIISAFNLLSLRSIFYIFIFLGNYLIIVTLYSELIKNKVEVIDQAVVLHLAVISVMLIAENLLSDDRAHLFFKEPSYLGVYLSGYIVYGIIRNQPSVIFLSWFISLLSISIFSIIAVLIGTLIFLLRNFNFAALRSVGGISIFLMFLLISPFLWGVLENNRYTSSLINLLLNFNYDSLMDFLIYRGGSRIDRMLSALHYFINHTNYFLGVGPGNFIHLNNASNNSGYAQLNSEQAGFDGSAINIFIEFLVEFGLLATILFFSFLLFWLIRLRVSIIYLLPVLVCMIFEGSYLRPAYWIAALLIVIACQNVCNLKISKKA